MKIAVFSLQCVWLLWKADCFARKSWFLNVPNMYFSGRTYQWHFVWVDSRAVFFTPLLYILRAAWNTSETVVGNFPFTKIAYHLHIPQHKYYPHWVLKKIRLSTTRLRSRGDRIFPCGHPQVPLRNVVIMFLLSSMDLIQLRVAGSTLFSSAAFLFLRMRFYQMPPQGRLLKIFPCVPLYYQCVLPHCAAHFR